MTVFRKALVNRFGVAGWVIFALALSAASVRSAETPPQGNGVPTTVVIRVVGSHAMALGDTVGGAAVTIKDAETGAVLASGFQTGPSGDLRSIMQTPRLPTEQVFSAKDSAAFKTELTLSKPTVVEVIGDGPLKYPGAKRRASKTVLLYPGKHVTGDGIVLQLNGMIVQIEAPMADRPLGIGDGVTVRATVRMMCDCIVEPYGNWDSRKMSLYGEWRDDDKVFGKFDFYHQGPKGIFLGDYTIPRWLKGKDRLTLRVVASDADGINVGYDEITYPLVPWEQSRDATGREIPPIAPPKP
jgi:hypothetical protein